MINVEKLAGVSENMEWSSMHATSVSGDVRGKNWEAFTHFLSMSSRAHSGSNVRCYCEAMFHVLSNGSTLKLRIGTSVNESSNSIPVRFSWMCLSSAPIAPTINW